MKDKKRYIPIKRTALDGKVWWLVYDIIEKKYSTFICHGRYKTKKECEARIEYCGKEYGIK